MEKSYEKNFNKDYEKTRMSRDEVIQKLRDRNYRITKQRLLLIDIILEDSLPSCKEIYYKASKIDRHIGMATVYRVINILEDIGAISRNSVYKICCSDKCKKEKVCIIELDNHKMFDLSEKNLKQVIKCGMEACGYADKEKIRKITIY